MPDKWKIILFLIPAIALGLAFAPPVSLASQDSAIQADNLITQVREMWQRSQDDQTKKEVKKNLELAEKMMKDDLKRNPNCEKCQEVLISTFFYQSWFGFSKRYDECIKTANQALSRYPANSRIALVKGYAHFYSQQYAEASKAMNRYLASVPPTQDTTQVKQMLQQSQQLFLTNWNRQANFYQSKESRIEYMNPQTYKMEAAFQATREWEMGLGSQGFTALTSNAPRLDDAELQSYVEDVVSRLVSKNPGSPFDYRVTIINSPEVNAVTPPGHVIVYRGLLEFANNEAELAGVLAHEIAHNYAHHSARAVIKGMLMQNIASSILRGINPNNQTAQLAANLTAQLGIGLFLNAYSRFEEKEADHYATHIMFNAGYNPTAISGFFVRMYQLNPKQPIKFLSTHPPDPDRASYLIDYLEGFPLDRELQMDSKNFQKIKARLGSRVPQNRGNGLPPSLN